MVFDAAPRTDSNWKLPLHLDVGWRTPNLAFQDQDAHQHLPLNPKSASSIRFFWSLVTATLDIILCRSIDIDMSSARGWW